MKYHRLPCGARMAYRELGQGTPLVMLHGWACSSAALLPLAESMQDDFRCLIPDLPGHGASDPVRPFSLPSVGEALAHWLNALSLSDPVLWGWSLGGQLAIQMVLQEPTLARALVLCSTTPRFVRSEEWPWALPSGQLRLLQRQLARDAGATSRKFRGDIYPELADLPLPQQETASEGLDLLSEVDLRPLLGAIRPPTLVLHGSTDAIIPCGAGDYIANQIPRARFCLLKGAGHAPFLDQPEFFIRELKVFLHEALN